MPVFFLRLLRKSFEEKTREPSLYKLYGVGVAGGRNPGSAGFQPWETPLSKYFLRQSQLKSSARAWRKNCRALLMRPSTAPGVVSMTSAIS